MAFLTIQELNTHLHDEQVETITRGDETIAQAAIDAAKNAKTIPQHAFTGAVEHAIAHIEEAAVHNMPEDLCNAGTDLKFRQDRYERAIDWLKAVQRGDVSPDLPDRETEEETGSNAPIGPIAYGSNPKRCQHF